MSERIPERMPDKVPDKTKFRTNILNDNFASYRLEIEGEEPIVFDSISGLGIETQVIEYTDGDNPLTHKRPGRFTYNNITIHNILITEEPSIYNWFEISRQDSGDYHRKSIAIVMMIGNNEIRRWNCFQCFPVSFNYHKMESKKSLYADMVIAVQWFEDA